MPTDWDCCRKNSVLDNQIIVVKVNEILGGFDSDKVFNAGELLFFNDEIHNIVATTKLHAADGRIIRVLQVGLNTLAYS